jgi:hypothetical protein
MNLLQRIFGTRQPTLNKPVIKPVNTISAVSNHNDINVTKCIGCRKGISLFTEKDGEYTHVDIFATPEAGSLYKCENSEIIGSFLMKNGENGTLLPNEESKAFFTKQAMWWEDIISLAYDTLKEQTGVSKFFNDGTINLTNIEIENKLVAIALLNGIELNEEVYPDLIRWNKSNSNN